MEFYFEKLQVWQGAMDLVEKIYKITRDFPQNEMFGIVAQIRRAVVSVPANIAEGQGRYHRKEFIQFLYTARGSLYEVITLMKVAQRLQYLSEKQVRELLSNCHLVASKLSGLINSMKSKT